MTRGTTPKAPQAERLAAIRLRYCINTHLDDQGLTAAPDIALVHQMIADAVTRAEGGTPASDTAQAAPAPADPGTADPSTSGASGAPAPAAAEPKKQKGPAPVTGGSVGSLSDGYAANQAEDLSAVC